MQEDDDDWEYDQTEESGEEEVEPPLRYKIMNYPADTTLQGYVDMWDQKELTVPEFQRDLVWSQSRASKFIESFLLGLPVPGVFLFKRRDASTYLIVDGQQRIKSIVSYIKGTFHEKVFKLKNVDAQWEGKTFSELPEDDRFDLKGAILRSTIIQPLDPGDHSSVYKIFARLNTGGVNLSPMEIRQCVSHGPFVSFLKEMNEDKNWRAILGKPRIDKRLRDVELVLRCIALYVNAADYKKPMKGFLDDYAEVERENPSDYDALGGFFKRACEEIVNKLGEKPFHLHDRINYGLLDSVLTCAMHNSGRDDLEGIVQTLKKSEQYLAAVTKNTSDTNEVSTRLTLATEAFRIDRS